MDRPFFHSTIDELEQLVKESIHSRAVLGRVWEELSYRDTERALRLKREVLGLLGGQIPVPPEPPPPDDPANQIPLL